MLSLNQIEAMERDFYSAVCSASDTGGLSLLEAADLSTRTCGRLLTEYKRLYEAHVRVLGTSVASG